MLSQKEITTVWQFDRDGTQSNAALDALPIRHSIAILLCTMQGQRFLREQLDSIVRQTQATWSIWASDDGSNDDTHMILQEYQAKLGESRLSMHNGPSEGFVANFLSLTCNASITADYYAYADQDDIWEPDKLARAAQWLQTVPSHVPALYCGRTRSVNANNQDIGLSPLYTRPPCFANAMVQSIAGGNTMMFNDAARKLLQLAGPNVKVVSHDWWVYMVVSGSGGRVFYDPQPTIRYRQHDNNLVGTNQGWSAGLVRLRMLFYGRFKKWNEINLAALQSICTLLTTENQHRLAEFSKARQIGSFARLAWLKRSGIHRQTLLGNIGLVAAAILKKI